MYLENGRKRHGLSDAHRMDLPQDVEQERRQAQENVWD